MKNQNYIAKDFAEGTDEYKATDDTEDIDENILKNKSLIKINL